MALHIQGVIRKSRQLRCADFTISSEDQEGERGDVNFAQLLQASITPTIGLDELLRHISPPAKHSASVRLDPEIIYARVPPTFVGFVLSFDGSAKTEKHGGYGSCSWILWKLQEWTILIASSAYLAETTVNLAEYTGMNNGTQSAL